MQRRRQNRGTREAKKLDFSNFLPLIASIRVDLGADWEFYREFLEGVIDASSRGETATAWYEQIEPLVRSNGGLRIAHEGVCFLIHEMEARKLACPVRSTNNMPPPPLHLRSSLTRRPSGANVQRQATERTVVPPAAPLIPTPFSTTVAQPRQSLDIAMLNHNRAHMDVPRSTLREQGAIFIADAMAKKEAGDHFQPADTNSHTSNVSTNLNSAYDGSKPFPTYDSDDSDFYTWLALKMGVSEEEMGTASDKVVKSTGSSEGQPGQQ